MGGHRGIVCADISYDMNSDKMTSSASDLVQIDACNLLSIDKVDVDRNDSGEERKAAPTSILFRVWETGRPDMNNLVSKLTGVLVSSLWELRMECLLNASPVSKDVVHEHVLQGGCRMPSRFRRMATDRQLVQDEWLDKGLELKVSSLSKATLRVSPGCDLESLLDQLLAMTTKSFSPLPVLAFVKARNGDYVELDESVKGIMKTVPDKEFLLVVDFSAQDHEAFLSLKAKRDSESSNSRRDSERQQQGVIEEGEVMARKGHVSLAITKETSCLVWYNVVKEVMEAFRKEWDMIISWANARGNLLTDLCGQKLGLFHSQVRTYRTERLLSMKIVLLVNEHYS